MRLAKSGAASLALLSAVLVAWSTGCSGRDVPATAAEFCSVYNADFARVAPFTPAGGEDENRARVEDIVRVIDRLQAASPAAIRPRTSEVRDYAHRLKKVLDRTGYDLRAYGDAGPPKDVLEVMLSSPMDALAAVEEFAAGHCA